MVVTYRQTIDMTPAGEILPRQGQLSWTARLGLAAALIAVLTGLGAAAAIFLWVASLLLPVAILAGLVAFAAFKLQLWKGRGPGAF